jgi:hypothetical protein
MLGAGIAITVGIIATIGDCREFKQRLVNLAPVVRGFIFAGGSSCAFHPFAVRFAV